MRSASSDENPCIVARGFEYLHIIKLHIPSINNSSYNTRTFCNLYLVLVLPRYILKIDTHLYSQMLRICILNFLNGFAIKGQWSPSWAELKCSPKFHSANHVSIIVETRFPKSQWDAREHLMGNFICWEVISSYHFVQDNDLISVIIVIMFCSPQ